MSKQHITVEMIDLPDRQRDRSTSRNRSGGTPVDVTPTTAFRAVINEDGADDKPEDNTSLNVDDGLLDSDVKNTRNRPNTSNDDRQPANGGVQRRRSSFSFPGYSGPRTVMINGIETAIPDKNVYQNKKTLAQGMMDLALLSANANQLRYVLESYRRHPYFYPSLIFISISIIFQVAVGVGLILNCRYNIDDEKEICKANKINNLTIIGIFIITVVNVFISAFGVADAPDGV